MPEPSNTPDPSKLKQQLQNSAGLSVRQAASRLYGQWSPRENGPCFHRSYEELARSVGLGTDRITLDALKRWVVEQKLPEPARR